MGLIVEDGAGLASAESYASVSEAGAYLRARGNGEAWDDAEQSDREIALRKAADFMRQVYRTRWAGARVHFEQRLDWPLRPDAQQLGFHPELGGAVGSGPHRVEILLVRERGVLGPGENDRGREGRQPDQVHNQERNARLERAVDCHPLGTRVHADLEGGE